LEASGHRDDLSVVLDRDIDRFEWYIDSLTRMFRADSRAENRITAVKFAAATSNVHVQASRLLTQMAMKDMIERIDGGMLAPSWLRLLKASPGPRDETLCAYWDKQLFDRHLEFIAWMAAAKDTPNNNRIEMVPPLVAMTQRGGAHRARTL
jgi:hypothetical protein